MSVKQFRALLNEAQLAKNDKIWFPRWVQRYASAARIVHGNLSVTDAEVVEFSRSLLARKVPAWQRLQAVRAVEAYRNLVLQTQEPSLEDMRRALGRLAARERTFGSAEASRPGVEDERHLIGQIDASEPPLIQQMRKEMRLRHKALETERAYVSCRNSRD